MKSKIIIIALMACGLVAGLSGCKKDDPKPSKTTGNLIIKTKLSGATNFLSDVEVSITGVGTFNFQTRVTDANGKADFGELNPGNYFYECTYDDGTTEYSGEGSVTITAGNDAEVIVLMQ